MLVSMSGRLECYESHAKIGNYSQYISDYHLCGIAKKSILADKQCFDFSADMIPITNSREAHNGEVPRVVAIDVKRYLKWWEQIRYFRSEL